MAKSLLKKKYSSISTPRNSRNVNLSAFAIYCLHCAYQHICYPCTKISLKRVSQITYHIRSRALLPDAQALCGLSKHQAVSKRGSGCLLPLPLLGVSPNPSPGLVPAALLHLPRPAEEEAAQTDQIPIPLHSPSESLSGRLSTALAACSDLKKQ